MACSMRSASSLQAPPLARSISRACVSACRSARTSGPRKAARRWLRPAPKSFSSPMVRPSSRTRTTSGSISWWRASPRRACRLLISTRSAGRMNSSSTAPPSSSMPTGASPCRCRCSRKRLPSPNGRAATRAGAWRKATLHACPKRKKRPGSPACSASRTMSRRTAFRAWCWAFRAASIQQWWPPWRSMRWAPIASIA